MPKKIVVTLQTLVDLARELNLTQGMESVLLHTGDKYFDDTNTAAISQRTTNPVVQVKRGFKQRFISCSVPNLLGVLAMVESIGVDNIIAALDEHRTSIETQRKANEAAAQAEQEKARNEADNHRPLKKVIDPIDKLSNLARSLQDAGLDADQIASVLLKSK